MTIEPYKSDHLEAVVRLALRAWVPVLASLGHAMEPYVFRAFYPEGWPVARYFKKL